METKVSSSGKEVRIAREQPTVVIGERINALGSKKVAAAVVTGELEVLRKEAVVQVQAGADILDVNVAAPGVDEVALLPQAVQAIMDVVDIPLCLDSNNPRALEAALKVYRGKPLINSVTGEERSLDEVLPLVKEYGAAVIGLTMDGEGISRDPNVRATIAHRIVDRAEALGIPREDVVIDCLALPLGADAEAGVVTIEAIRRVVAELGTNLTIGASNISFGLPDRALLNSVFLAIVIAAGVNCPIVDPVKAAPIILATDLALGRDPYAMRYIRGYRQRQRR